MRLKLINRQDLSWEMAAVVTQSPNYVVVDFLTFEIGAAGPGGILDLIRQAISRVDAKRFHGIVLGFGFHPQELAGLHARVLPIVVPRPMPFRSPPAPFGRLSLFWKSKMPNGNTTPVSEAQLEFPEPSPPVTGPELSVFRHLVDGYWSHDEFLVVPRGWRLVAKAQGRVLAAEKLPK